MDHLHYIAIINLIEDNWSEFVDRCDGNEEVAEETLQELKSRAGTC